MLQNLINRVKLMFVPDGAGSGSADNSNQQAGNAEDSLLNAFNTEGDAGAGGVKPDAKPAGDKAAGGTGTEGGEIKLPAWTEQLPPELRSNPELAGKLAKFNKVGDMAKEFLELSVKAASGGIPGKDATAEETAAFWEKAGRPKTADGYSFAGNKELQGAVFADIAHKANLTVTQADAMFKGLNDLGSKELAARTEAAATAQKQQATETAKALAAEFGSKYQEKMELLKRGLAAAGPNVGKLISQAGLAGNPEIVKAFITFGEMTAESSATRGGGAGEALKSIEEGGSFNYK